ncbi:MAG TPA: NADPH-dependent FMN reductase [Nevskiaceae bacterium]|nr:NADPH-dependent FMN reductase [Nevskiaceae bacterium]
MTSLVVIPGSWRTGSFNVALARAAIAAAPAGCTCVLESIKDIPLYDGDVEARGTPAAVTRLKEVVAAADGVLMVSPEYNNSVPGTFKNAIDWLSRPDTDIARVFGGRPFGLIGASPGMGGTRLSQNAWLPTLRVLGVNLYSARFFYVAGAHKVFDPSGALVDDKTRDVLGKYMQGFGAFVAKNKRTASP